MNKNQVAAFILIAGWSLFQSWPYVAFMSDTLLPCGVNSSFSGFYLSWPISLAVLVVCFVIAANASFDVSGRLSKRGCIASFLVVFLSGNLLVVLAGLSSNEVIAAALCVIGAIITGIGSCFLHLSWQNALTRLPSNQIEVGVPAGFSCSIVLSFGISALPAFFGTIAFFACLILSALILAQACRVPEMQGERAALPDDPKAVRQVCHSVLSVRMAACTFVMVSVLWLSIELIETQIVPLRVADEPLFVFKALSGLIIAMAFICYDFLFSRSAHTSSAMKVCIALVGISLVLAGLEEESLATPSYSVNFAANSLGFIFLISTSVELSKKVPGSVPFFTALTLTPLYAGTCLAAFARPLLNQVEPLDICLVLGVSLLLVALFIVPWSLGGGRTLREDDEWAMHGGPKDIEGLVSPESAQPESPETDTNAVKAIVETYGLTKREAEVLELFAAGRDSGYIREKLVVSRDTVSSHLKHIYAKIGIHSKRELLDLVESLSNEA